MRHCDTLQKYALRGTQNKGFLNRWRQKINTTLYATLATPPFKSSVYGNGGEGGKSQGKAWRLIIGVLAHSGWACFTGAMRIPAVLLLRLDHLVRRRSLGAGGGTAPAAKILLRLRRCSLSSSTHPFPPYFLYFWGK